MSENISNCDTFVAAEEGPAAEALESDSTQTLVEDNDDTESATKSKKRSWLKGKKRPAEPLSEAEVAEIQLKRIRQRLVTTPRSELNTVMVLNEYRKQLNYEVINLSGPSQVPFYTAHVNVDGLVFEGSGASKKKAKIAAAEAALIALFGDILPPPDVVVSSSDDFNKEAGCEAVAIDSCVNGLNPTTVVNRLRPGTAYADVDINTSDIDVSEMSTSVLSPMYRISCVIDDVTYIGTGLSKKVARANAAAEALEKGFGISCTRTSTGFPVYVGEMPQITAPSRLASVAKKSPPNVQTEPQPQLLCSLPGTKTALMLLHELYPNVELTSSDVADENKLFHSSIKVEERVFEGKASSKKLARSAAAIRAVNYLHQTGYLNMRLAEKASVKKPKWQPPQKAQFSQVKSGPARGGFYGQRGRGRGRGGAGRGGNLVNEIKDSSWISGGVLKAGDFLGLNKVGTTAAQQLSFLNEQDYYSQGAYASDDSYVTANDSFTSGFASPSGNFQGSSAAQGNMGSTQGFVGKQKTGFNRSVGSELTGSMFPNSTTSVGRGRGRGRSLNQTSVLQQTSFSPRQSVGVKKLMELGYEENNSMNPTFVTSYIDRQSGSFTSSGVMAPRKPNAVVQLSDNYETVPVAAAAHGIATPAQHAVNAIYEYAYADYGQGYGDATESAAYASGMTGSNQGDVQDYGIYYSQYGGSY